MRTVVRTEGRLQQLCQGGSSSAGGRAVGFRATAAMSRLQQATAAMSGLQQATAAMPGWMVLCWRSCRWFSGYSSYVKAPAGSSSYVRMDGALMVVVPLVFRLQQATAAAYQGGWSSAKGRAVGFRASASYSCLRVDGPVLVVVPLVVRLQQLCQGGRSSDGCRTVGFRAPAGSSSYVRVDGPQMVVVPLVFRLQQATCSRSCRWLSGSSRLQLQHIRVDGPLLGVVPFVVRLQQLCQGGWSSDGGRAVGFQPAAGYSCLRVDGPQMVVVPLVFGLQQLCHGSSRLQQLCQGGWSSAGGRAVGFQAPAGYLQSVVSLVVKLQLSPGGWSSAGGRVVGCQAPEAVSIL